MCVCVRVGGVGCTNICKDLQVKHMRLPPTGDAISIHKHFLLLALFSFSSIFLFSFGKKRIYLNHISQPVSSLKPLPLVFKLFLHLVLVHLLFCFALTRL